MVSVGMQSSLRMHTWHDMCILAVRNTISSMCGVWGADEAIDYNKVDVHEEIMRRTNGRGVDCVVNTLNTWTATRDLGMLAFGGQLVAIEGLPRFEEFTFFEKAISIHEVALGAAQYQW